MTYIKWVCKKCEDIKVSNTNRRHELNSCKCDSSYCDAEEGYTRWGGEAMGLEDYDYNFFDELVICMKEQGYDTTIKIFDPFQNIYKLYLPMEKVYIIREMEDNIMESLI